MKVIFHEGSCFAWLFFGVLIEKWRKNHVEKDEPDGWCRSALCRSSGIFISRDGIRLRHYRQVFHWRGFALNQYFAFTLDAQHIRDRYDTDTIDPEGFIGSVRMTAEF